MNKTSLIRTYGLYDITCMNCDRNIMTDRGDHVTSKVLAAAIFEREGWRCSKAGWYCPDCQMTPKSRNTQGKTSHIRMTKIHEVTCAECGEISDTMGEQAYLLTSKELASAYFEEMGWGFGSGHWMCSKPHCYPNWKYGLGIFPPSPPRKPRNKWWKFF